MVIQYVSVGILINANNEILMEKNQSNPNFAGLWQFPGGKVEKNECPREALKRELTEELGIICEDDNILPFHFVEYVNSNKKSMVILFYICVDWMEEIQPLLQQELTWFNIDELNDIPHLPYNKVVINKLLNEIQ